MLEKTKRRGSALLALALMCAMHVPIASAEEVQVRAVEAASERGITIIGDKELPKVLYIVPWKMPRPPSNDHTLSPPTYLAPMSPCQMQDPTRVQTAGAWPCESRPR